MMSTEEPEASQTTAQAQLSLRFLHERAGPIATMEAYDIRMRIKDMLPSAPLDALTIQPSEGSVLLAARTPAASTWMGSQFGEVMECVANIAGRPLAVDPIQTEVAAYATKERHLYKIPRLVVKRSKSSTSWDGWRKPELDNDLREQLGRLIQNGLSDELKVWGCAPLAVPITLVSDGRPMPICPANGPRGMARLGVTFISPVRIDGGLFVGIHTLLGHGAVHRGGTVSRTNDEGVAQ
jgi:hypothetical protein